MEVNMLSIMDVVAQVSAAGGVVQPTADLPVAEGGEFGALLQQAMVEVEVELLPEGEALQAQQAPLPAFASTQSGVAQDTIEMMLRLTDQGVDVPLTLPGTEMPSQNAQGPLLVSAHGEVDELRRQEPAAEDNDTRLEAGLLTTMVAATLLATTVNTAPKEPAAPVASAVNVVTVDNGRSLPGMVPAEAAQETTVSLPAAAAQNAQQEAMPVNPSAAPVAHQAAPSPMDEDPVVKEMSSEMAKATTKTSQQKLPPEQLTRGADSANVAAGREVSLQEVSASKEPAKPVGILARDLATEVSIADSTAQGDVSGDTGQSLTGSGHQQASAVAHGSVQHAVLGNKPVEQSSGVVTQPTLQAVNHEAIIEQVRDRLTAHEVRTDGNQVRLQLNPAELGELQITLRMDDQKLRVEILAESKAVKTALLEHADTLKEVLARQNITVERLEVGTGGQDGLGRFFREGGRPEEQLRPFARLGQHGGFRQEMPGGRTMAAWQPRSNALVDVRF